MLNQSCSYSMDDCISHFLKHSEFWWLIQFPVVLPFCLFLLFFSLCPAQLSAECSYLIPSSLFLPYLILKLLLSIILSIIYSAIYIYTILQPQFPAPYRVQPWVHHRRSLKCLKHLHATYPTTSTIIYTKFDKRATSTPMLCFRFEMLIRK